MLNTLKKIFKSNLFIGIISSIIASILFAFGKKIIDIPKANIFFQHEFNIKVWVLLLILLITILVFYFLLKFLRNKIKLRFLNYKKDNFRGWGWIWTWEKTQKNTYKISNLRTICHNCKDGVLSAGTLTSKTYDCVKCGYQIPITHISNDLYRQIKDEIIYEVGKRYPKETLYLE